MVATRFQLPQESCQKVVTSSLKVFQGRPPPLATVGAHWVACRLRTMGSTRPVCGIDLGTTTSAATLYIPATESKPAHVVMIKLGKVGDTIPSVVCRSSSTMIWKAGDNAVSEVERDRAKTPLITRSKRLVGLQYADVEERVLKQMTLVKEGKSDGHLKGRPVFEIGEWW